MKKKKHIKVKFSTILLCISAILLCAVPCGAQINVGIGETLNVSTQINNHFYVYGTMNLYPGAYVDDGIYAFNGSTVNIYAGGIGTGSFIMGSNSTAVVTVYGTGFAVDGELLDPSASQFSVVDSGVLTGSYENGAPISLKFFSLVPIHLVNLDPEVEIDIKPGSDLNSINLKSKGVVPVAVLTTDGTDGFDAFDAGDVDPYTVEFAGTKPIRWNICDVDDDGNDDMLFHFDTQELFKNDLNEDSTEATLTGKTKEGILISGTDTVRIVPQKK